MNGATAEARDLIAAAERASRTVCEVCGGVGTACQSRGGWYRALCEVHAAEVGYTVANP